MRTVIYVAGLTIADTIMKQDGTMWNETQSAAIAGLLILWIAVDVVEFYFSILKGR